MFDIASFGGNGDGIIDNKDVIFSRLRVWIDANHNGIADFGELLTLGQVGIASISLNYQKANWTDPYGNQFVNKAKVVRVSSNKNNGKGQGNGGGLNQWAYDVILATSPEH